MWTKEGRRKLAKGEVTQKLSTGKKQIQEIQIQPLKTAALYLTGPCNHE